MKSIVTGGNGFIGSHIVDRLVEKSWEVVVIDDNSAECNDKFYYNDKAKNYKINICDYDLICPLFEGVDVVFHLAAESRIQPAILNPCYTTEVNVVGTCNVLQAARENNVDRVVYSSTSSGYGRKNNPPLMEDMPKDCLNPYSVAKCAGEELCSMYTSLFGLKTLSFRYFNVYGERQPTRGQYAPVVGLFLKQYAEGKAMTIVGDGTQRRDFTNIHDAVEANILAAETENESAFGQVFNVGTGINFSILDIVNKIGGKYKNISPRIGESKTTLADNNKIKEILGWEPKIQFMNWMEKELKKEKYKK